MFFPQTPNFSDIPLPEYPRPQLVRNSYICLNGDWDYVINSENTLPNEYVGRIKVPYSPESKLSGVSRKLSSAETLWYRRTFTLSEDFMKDRLIIHFGAVDFFADVYINGSLAFCHSGGYTAFSFDITEFIHLGENEVIVAVRDESDTSYHSRGKQREKRGGIWYTSQSGIWQTVWLESVPSDYISSLLIVPSIKNSSVSITVMSESDADAVI
jgi:hypothetical protein